jgi:hypothetical protein
MEIPPPDPQPTPIMVNKSDLEALRDVPHEIRVRSGLLYVLLQPISEELKFRLRHYDTLASLDEAKQTLFHFML